MFNYKELLYDVPCGGRFLLLKVIVLFLGLIEAIFSSGAMSCDRFIIFSSSINNCLCFCEATICYPIVASTLINCCKQGSFL